MSTPDLKKTRRHRSGDGNGSLNRLPPHAPEVEQALLGCVLLDPARAMPVCQERLTADAFYDLRNRTIYECLAEMSERAEKIDVVTLDARLRDKGQNEAVGGTAYVSGLPDCTPSAVNVEDYAAILREKLMLRSVIQHCTEAVGRVYDRPDEADVILDELERDVMRIARTGVQAERGIGPLILGAMAQIEDYHGRSGILTGLPTGFADFNKLTGGLQASEMIVLAARPSVGKTSLALNIADHVACELRLPVGIMSLEMTANALAMRLLTSRARVSLRNVRDGFLAERDVPRLISAAAKLKAAPMVIDDSSSMTILQLKAKARRMRQRHGIRLLIVDYMQLVTSSRRDGRQQEVADVSNGLKALAKELEIPVLALSQLNRSLDKERRRPVLADLRESGAIDQDADVVAFLHKPRRRKEDDEPRDASEVILSVEKQRNGPTADVNLMFIREYTRFESAAKISEEAEQSKEKQGTWTDKL